MSMFGLGSLLLVAALTGRYGLAGVVSAGVSVSYAASSAPVARLADRYGQRRVLRPAMAVFAAATVVFVACAQARAPFPVLLAAGCVAGAAMPALGSMVRARWSVLLPAGQGLAAAYALESVVDECCFVIGPAVVTVLATEVLPAAGVIAAGVLCVLGTLALAAQVGTEPPAARQRGAGRPATGDTPAAQPGTRRAVRLPAPGLVTLAPVVVALCAMFASIDLSTVAFAQQHGHKPLAGFILGTYALGSAVGGLWYGTRRWRAPLDRRFAASLVLAVAGAATFWAVPGLIVLEAVVFVAGLAISPTLIAAYGLIESQAPPARRTEGMAWISAAAGIGVAAGSAAAGLVVDAGGARWGYVQAAGCGALAALACLAGWTRLRPGPAPGLPPDKEDTSHVSRGAGGAIITEQTQEG
jgi:MFS family permease